MKYSIIIPIFKEEKNILKLMKLLNHYLNGKIKFEIIFVDDNSMDNSKKIFLKYKKKNMRFLSRKIEPRDLSKSVVFGFEKAKYQNLIVMDGDLQHHPKDILKLIKKYENSNSDIVIGKRNLRNFKIANLNPIRFIFSILLNKIFNMLFKKTIYDPMSGFFVIKKKIYLDCKNRLMLVGYKILIDLIVSSKIQPKIQEIQIDFKVRDRGFSKMRLKILIQLFYFLLIKLIKK